MIPQKSHTRINQARPPKCTTTHNNNRNSQSMDDIRRFMCGGLGPPTLLKSHIQRTHPGASFPKNAIDLLWKCF
ncbi:uncharacterized protein BO66DRAFT_184744 [Aspergillus aculeatinus CBS 121060]|uniref:Uncharacterized protein n=1 Tax=Aspergillus aculeatinus CBS 121060 TaxID=1448322 RepID=A0ACD1GZ03_9EURO|nr:hypothetical protein BO66DRAFT_184744 [Aspergillus aculeatinus CBS 121060]RAH66411.1 hypothetical protein BO66DRAFT_184744 [Aspergillus aculeatinus CBS 121060]